MIEKIKVIWLVKQWFYVCEIARLGNLEPAEGYPDHPA